jgi:hypothetical protein
VPKLIVASDAGESFVWTLELRGKEQVTEVLSARIGPL